jgi:hypothetical protein
VPFGGLLLSLEGERFPLLSALVCDRFTVLCALLCRLGMLHSFSLALGFLRQRTLTRGFAEGRCRADARDEVEVLAALNLLAGGASAVQGRGLRAVTVMTAEIDLSPVGRGGVSGGMPVRLPGAAPASPSAAS